MYVYGERVLGWAEGGRGGQVCWSYLYQSFEILSQRHAFNWEPACLLFYDI